MNGWVGGRKSVWVKYQMWVSEPSNPREMAQHSGEHVGTIKDWCVPHYAIRW